MTITAKVTFYDIKALGYYRRGEDAPLFGNLPGILEQLRQWATSPDLVLRDTCTYEPNEGTGTLKTFCFDIVNHVPSGDFLLTTWNEIPTIDGKTPTVNGNGRVGIAQISLTPLPDNGIPGHPTYFWFIPQDNRFATLTLGSILNGHSNLKYYMRGFLERFSTHVSRHTNENGEIVIAGYRNVATEQPEGVSPRFESSLCRNPTALSYIREARTSISKCIRKTKVDPSVERDVGFLRNIWEHATGIDREASQPLSVMIRYEVNVTPTQDDLEAIITQWESEATTRWDDVGFQISGDETKIRWLSHSLARAEFELEIVDQTAPALSATSLLSAIQLQRETMRSIVRRT